MTPKPFEAGKNAKELGIDVTRSFIIVDAFDWMINDGFPNGTIVKLRKDDGSKWPYFFKENGEQTCVGWDQLAYADEPAPEPYKPCVGDRVSVKGHVVDISEEWQTCQVEINGFITAFSYPQIALLSRSPRKVTRAEVEKLLGGEFELVD
mgnify:CR=1 FL=1